MCYRALPPDLVAALTRILDQYTTVVADRGVDKEVR